MQKGSGTTKEALLAHRDALRKLGVKTNHLDRQLAATPSTKSSGIAIIPEKPLTIKIHCGDCIYFEKDKIYSHPCSAKEIGKIKESNPCGKFSLDPASFDAFDAGLLDLLKIVSSINRNHLPKVAALLLQAEKVQRKGFYLGQEVYIRAFPRDYISNFVVGRVIGATLTHIIVQGAKGFRAMVFHDSVYTKERWHRLARNLERKGLIQDPSQAIKISKIDHQPKELSRRVGHESANLNTLPAGPDRPRKRQPFDIWVSRPKSKSSSDITRLR